MLGNEGMIQRRGASQSATLVVAASDSLHPERADYVCDGVDDQVEIQAAIDALPSGGGEVACLEGTYNFRDEVIIDSDNIRLTGHGTFIRCDEISQDLSADCVAGSIIVKVSDASVFDVGLKVGVYDDTTSWGNEVSYGVITAIDTVSTPNEITLDTPSTRDYTTANNAKVGTLFNLISVKSAKNIVIDGITLDGNSTNNPTVHVGAIGAEISFRPYVTDSIVTNVNIRNSPKYAILLDWYHENIKIINCNIKGVEYKGVDFGGYSKNDSITQTIIDVGDVDGTNWGIYFCDGIENTIVADNVVMNANVGIGPVTPSGGSHKVVISNNDIYNCKKGIYVQHGYASTTITGNMLLYTTTAIYLGDCSGVIISDNIVENDGSHGKGVLVDTGSADIVLSHNLFYNLSEAAIEVKSSSYNVSLIGNVMETIHQGVYVVDSHDITILNNIISNASSNIYVTNSNAIHYRNNIGFVTENSGTATITNGSTSIVVDHGLDVTPSAGDIMVTPMGSLGSASFFYIDTFTSTQFTIHVDANPGANVDFAWKAIVL